jgi:hypothetical protein
MLNAASKLYFNFLQNLLKTLSFYKRIFATQHIYSK